MIERELRYQQQLQEFVLKAIREAVAEEREACARLAESVWGEGGNTYVAARRYIAAAIRARGSNDGGP